MTPELDLDSITSGEVVVGIGVDLVEVERMRTVLDRTPRFAQRVLSAAERDYCLDQAVPEQHVAARFAAKEAVIKVLGSGLFSVDLTDIAVERDRHGAPSLVLGGRAAEAADQMGVRRWLLSLTHTDDVAAAFVVAIGRTR